MADESERNDRGPTPDGGAFAALAFASASRDKADRYLDEQVIVARAQAEVLRLQAEDLRREDKLRHWSLRVRHVSDVMKLTFELSVAAIVLAFAVLIGTAIWKAAHDHSLVIESFSVPADLAARGVTGEAVAAQLQDKLTAMQAATNSARPPDSYANNWGADIKVQIPDTGVSVGEFYRLLVSWFGSQTRISGEMYRTADGLAVATRATGEAGDVVRGSEKDLDTLMQKAAETVYARTQPFRYAVYLVSGSQPDGVASLVLLQNLARTGSAQDRSWAYMGLSTREEYSDPLHAPKTNALAIPLTPGFALPYQNIAGEEFWAGHDEAALAAARKAVALLAQGDGEMSARASAISLPAGRAHVEEMIGDFPEALRQDAQCAMELDYAHIAESCRSDAAYDEARQHDRAVARGDWSSVPVPSNPVGAVQYRPFEVSVLYGLGDWNAVIRKTGEFEAFLKTIEGTPPFSKIFAPVTLSRQVWPYTAAALAHTGHMKDALALIGRTPLDCDLCVRMRGNIAALNHDWEGAAHWFAMVSARAPSIPFADTEWGTMLLAKGDLDGAIAKFESANKKGPHFADPLETWGEVLVAKNRSDLALAKFAEAAKYAPNWGRLHLKWGEALLWSGDKDGAQKQFATAAALDLTPSEKSELVKVDHG